MAPILVTGGTGYVAGWCIVQLLQAGHSVRTTVRSTSRVEAVRRAVTSQVDAGDRLSFVVADLTSDDGWDAAVAGVEGVLHVASPLPAHDPKDPDEVIRPAREGALRVLRAATRAGVRRVVLTSSMAACTPGASGDLTIDDATWTDPRQPGLNPYRTSKVLAEQAAWAYAAEHPGAPELVTILPGSIFGPSLPGTSESSTGIIKAILTGQLPAIPRVEMAVVDVRDVASAHLLALDAPGAAGRRYLVASEVVTMRETAALLRAELGAQARKVSRVPMPDAVLRLLARVAPPLSVLVPMLGRHLTLKTDHVRADLGWTPRPASETLLDTARGILAA